MAKLLFDREKHPDITFDDVFLLPNNPVREEVLQKCGSEERTRLLALEGEEDSRMARSFVLELAEKYNIGGQFSRDDVDLTPRGGLANTPMVIANMNNVSGRRMAEAIARVGGIAAIPQDKTDKEIEGIVDYMRTRHPLYETPVQIESDTKVHDFRRVLGKRSHDAAVVTNGGKELLGILANSDLPQGINADVSVEPFVRREDLLTAPDGIEALEALELLEKHPGIRYLPILDAKGGVVGVFTRTDAAMRLRYKPNIDAENGGLRAMYTVGALNKNPLDRVRFLMDNGVRDILFDTANFDQGTAPYRNVEKAAALAAQRCVRINLIAGNVVTREATRNILLAGASFVKVGVGPGAMCTTRMKTGVGRPQVSAILECVEEASKHNGYVIADGGIQYPRDVAVALASGADYVMAGSLFAGTYESPGDLQHDERGAYKVNYGMASTRASVLRTIGRTKRTPNQIFRDAVGHRSEGISEGRVYLKPDMESVALLQHDLLDGAASSAAYANALSFQEFPKKAVMGIQTPSGFKEGTAKATF
jgi:IMP dehydrogenase